MCIIFIIDYNVFINLEYYIYYIYIYNNNLLYLIRSCI